METKTCQAAWREMTAISAEHAVRNYVQVLDMGDYVVESPLFPSEALDAYTAFNMGNELSPEQRSFLNEMRGGRQGDYSEGMTRKIDNVVDCLTRFPQSKRAVITVSNEPMPDHSTDEDAKCLRELHLYLDDDGKLSGTVFFRAQAALIFPKNIHLIGSIMSEVAGRLPGKPALGYLFYLATVLVEDRS
jgi:thymidylate synthase